MRRGRTRRERRRRRPLPTCPTRRCSSRALTDGPSRRCAVRSSDAPRGRRCIDADSFGPGSASSASASSIYPGGLQHAADPQQLLHALHVHRASWARRSLSSVGGHSWPRSTNRSGGSTICRQGTSPAPPWPTPTVRSPVPQVGVAVLRRGHRRAAVGVLPGRWTSAYDPIRPPRKFGRTRWPTGAPTVRVFGRPTSA